IGDVHRTALAAAQAAVPGKQLLHHRLDVAALGDAMAMAAMGAGDMVAVGQVHAHADRRRFLAGVEVDEARDVAGGKFLLHPVLEGANGAHVAIGADQLVAAQLHRNSSPVRLGLGEYTGRPCSPSTASVRNAAAAACASVPRSISVSIRKTLANLCLQPLTDAIGCGPNGLERVGAPPSPRTGRLTIGTCGVLSKLGRGI